LAAAREGAAVEPLPTVRATVKGMLLNAGRGLQAAGAIVLGLAFAAWLALTLGSVRFDEGGRLLRAVFQFCDASQGGVQLGLEGRVLLAQGRHLLAQRLVLGLQGCYFIRRHHRI
jgi:hypothetical protein